MVDSKAYRLFVLLCVMGSGPEVSGQQTQGRARSIVVTEMVHHADERNREPMVAELADGTLLVTGFPSLPHLPARPPSLWRSRDRGRAWQRVDVGTPARGAVGNSDVDLAVAPDGTMYFLTMGFDRAAGEGTHVSIGVSKDNGSTWSWTYLSQTRLDDRPWVDVAPDGTAHVIWNDGSGVSHAVSVDGGVTWDERPKVNDRGGSSHLAVGPNGEVAVRITPVSASGNRYDEDVDLIAVSTDAARTWRRHAAPGTREWGADGRGPPPRWVEPLAWDADGSLYHLWSEGREMWLGRSADHGVTWTTWRIARADDLLYFPFLVARGSGELAATWFSVADGPIRVSVIKAPPVDSDAAPSVVMSEPLRLESWMESEGEWVHDPAGEYVPVTFLSDGDLAVVTPLQDERTNRFGFTWWRLELR